ncbi:MAG: hypothetical protein K6G68_01530 [Oscillospiraceae bacterium]|nr:hypothetical protein [Oscillospiraceae bacterium]
MKDIKNAQTTIMITSYENGKPFSTQHKVRGIVDDEVIITLCKRNDFLRNAEEHRNNEGEHAERTYKISIEDTTFPDVSDKDICSCDEENTDGFDELYEEEEHPEKWYYRMSRDVQGMKRLGAVILAAQFLLSVGFFRLHHKMVRGNGNVNRKGV